jgi:hypothetical protein
MAFFETSAKNNINVKETFYYLAKEIKARASPSTPLGISINKAFSPKKDATKKAGCC